jgi:hypothetical protein
MSVPRRKAAGNAGRPGAAPPERLPEASKVAGCEPARLLKYAVELLADIGPHELGDDELDARYDAFMVAIYLGDDPYRVSAAMLKVLKREVPRAA